MFFPAVNPHLNQTTEIVVHKVRLKSWWL